MTLQGQIFEFYVFDFKTGIGGLSGSLIKNLALFFSYDLKVEGCLTLQDEIFTFHTYGFKTGIRGVFGVADYESRVVFSYDLQVEAKLDPSRSNF